MYLKPLLIEKVYERVLVARNVFKSLNSWTLVLVINFGFILVNSLLHWHSMLPSICLPLIPRLPIRWTRKAEKLYSITIANKTACIGQDSPQGHTHKDTALSIIRLLVLQHFVLQETYKRLSFFPLFYSLSKILCTLSIQTWHSSFYKKSGDQCH